MKRLQLFLFIVIVLLCSCANPSNRATSDNYAKTCLSAEKQGRLQVAEAACYRALVNVEVGNLGAELKSQRLYNLGRIKRQLGKFKESEALFKDSLKIEEKLSTSTDPKIGRRLVELSVSLAGQGKWAEGAQYLARMLPMARHFTGHERAYTAKVLNYYSVHLKKLHQDVLADQFAASSAELN